LRLADKSIHLAGISMGGHIAGVYAAIYNGQVPGHIRSLALHCCHGVQAEPSRFLLDISSGRDNWLVCRNPDDVRRLTTRLFYKPPWVPSRYYDLVHQDKMDRSHVLNKIMEDLLTPPFPLQAHLHQLSMPVFIAWGKQDQIIDVSCVEVLKASIPGPTTVHVYDECGHALLVEKVNEVGADHMKWLKAIEEETITVTTPLLAPSTGSTGPAAGAGGLEYKASSSSSASDDGKGVFPH